MKKTIVITMCLILAVAGLGCATLSAYLTPAPVNQKAVEYVVNSGQGHVEDFEGYPNLEKAMRLQEAVDTAYKVNQFQLQQLAEQNDLEYSLVKKTVAADVAVGRQREGLLFGETGIMPLILGIAGVGGLTGFLGLMRKRPGDITQADFDKAIADIDGTRADQLSQRERQLSQVVKGVQRFINTYTKNPPAGIDAGKVLTDLKDLCDKEQDTDTQIAVAGIKKTI